MNDLREEVHAYHHQETPPPRRDPWQEFDAHVQFLQRLHGQWHNYYLHSPAWNDMRCSSCGHPNSATVSPSTECSGCGKPLSHNLWEETRVLLDNLRGRLAVRGGEQELSEAGGILAQVSQMLTGGLIGYLLAMEEAAEVLTAGLRAKAIRRRSSPGGGGGIVVNPQSTGGAPAAAPRVPPGADIWPIFQELARAGGVTEEYCRTELGLGSIQFDKEGRMSNPDDLSILGTKLRGAYNQVKTFLETGSPEKAKEVFLQHQPLIQMGTTLRQLQNQAG